MKHTYQYKTVQNYSAKHPLITGTILLTGAGFLSRIIGFFYRIYMSRLFGEEGMGIYQMIHPISALAFSLTGAAFQTAISRFVAAQTDSSSAFADTCPAHLVKSYRPLTLGLSVSLPLSCIVAAALYLFASPIAVYYLAEPRATVLLRLLTFTVPFSAAHACINGYFYGIQKASVPAGTQLLEQIVRVGAVRLLVSALIRSSASGEIPTDIDISIAVIGLIAGEAAGLAGSLMVLLRKRRKENVNHTHYINSGTTYTTLLAMVIPLAANRVFLNSLHSLEATALPAGLRAYGYDHSTALSVYGVLTGMAMPLIFFPNALTGSISVMLLPSISESTSLGKKSQVKHTILQTIQLCSVMGLFCMGFFLLFGQRIGTYIFESELAGYFICELSFLCPFLYLNSTLSGVIQGLGKVTPMFLCNVTALLVRLLFIYLIVPIQGMQGYLWGVLISQILQTALYLTLLMRRDRQKTLASFLQK